MTKKMFSILRGVAVIYQIANIGAVVEGFAPRLSGRLIGNSQVQPATSPLKVGEMLHEEFPTTDDDKNNWKSLERAYGVIVSPSFLAMPRMKDDDPLHSESLYDNSENLLILSMLVYEYVALRDFAKHHKDNKLWNDLSPPKQAKDLLPVLEANLHLIGVKQEDVDNQKKLVGKFVDELKSLDFENAKKSVKDFFDEDSREKYNTQVDEAKEFLDKAKRISSAFSKEEHLLQESDGRTLLQVHDSNEHVDSSSVHAVAVNHDLKRVSIVFRGTENRSWKSMFRDWTSNFNFGWRPEENPVEELQENLIPRVHLHNGFAKSLLGYRYDHAEDATRTLHGILNEEAKLCVSKGYRLFVTGHSMGAAVATILAFYAAADPRFTANGPVVLFTYQSPRVGDSNFRSSFRHLETQGKIRHCRVHNSKDQATKIPPFGQGYRHVGMEISLRSNDPPFLDYPVDPNWQQARSAFLDLFKDWGDVVKHHSCSLLMERLQRANYVLERTSYENEYRRLWGLPLVPPHTGEEDDI